MYKSLVGAMAAMTAAGTLVGLPTAAHATASDESSLGVALSSGEVPVRHLRRKATSEAVYTLNYRSDGCFLGGSPVKIERTEKLTVAAPAPPLERFEPAPDAPDRPRLSSVTVKAGTVVCELPWSIGAPSVQWRDGEVVAVTTSENPSVEELLSLGLSPSTPVASDVWVPRPRSARREAQWPLEIRPIRSWVEPAVALSGEDSRRLMVEWEVVGGEGLWVNRISAADASGEITPLDGRQGSVTLVQSGACFGGTSTGKSAFEGHLESDFGQFELPERLTRGWASTVHVPRHDQLPDVALVGSSFDGAPLLGTIPWGS